jgi:hypothetical protein
VVGVAVAHPNDRSSIPIRDEFRNCHAKSRFYYIKKCLVPPRHGFIFFIRHNSLKPPTCHE